MVLLFVLIPIFSTNRIFLFVFLINAVSYHTQNYLGYRGNGGAKTNMKQCGPFQLTHQIDRRDSHTKRADYTLYHDKHGFSTAVKIANEAKKNSGEQAVDGIGLQIVVGIGDDFCFT